MAVFGQGDLYNCGGEVRNGGRMVVERCNEAKSLRHVN